ncbi:MAG: glycine cleavage system protein GcvH [Actinomycetota bacterium]
MNVPAHLRYTKDHEWIYVDGDTVRMGITDYAQDALGDIVFIQLPSPGDVVGTNQSFSEIESTKSVNDVYAPVAGTVSAVNESLRDRPELLNSDPYGEGWICELGAVNMAGAELIDADAYRGLIGA